MRMNIVLLMNEPFEFLSMKCFHILKNYLLEYFIYSGYLVLCACYVFAQLIVFSFSFLVVLGIKRRASHRLGKCSATGYIPSPLFFGEISFKVLKFRLFSFPYDLHALCLI